MRSCLIGSGESNRIISRYFCWIDSRSNSMFFVLEFWTSILLNLFISAWIEPSRWCYDSWSIRRRSIYCDQKCVLKRTLLPSFIFLCDSSEDTLLFHLYKYKEWTVDSGHLLSMSTSELIFNRALLHTVHQRENQTLSCYLRSNLIFTRFVHLVHLKRILWGLILSAL